MDTIVMNSEKRKISDTHIRLLHLLDKWSEVKKFVLLSTLSIYYEGKIIKKSCKSYKFKISAPT